MTPPDLLSRSRNYVRKLGWFVRGMDDDDLVSIFVLGGLEAMQGKPWSWGTYIFAGRCDLRDAVRASTRMCRKPKLTTWSLDSYGETADEVDLFAQREAELTLHALMQQADLTALERESILSFLRGERTALWGGRTGERDRQHNAVYKAITKLREAAQPKEVQRGAAEGEASRVPFDAEDDSRTKRDAMPW